MKFRKLINLSCIANHPATARCFEQATSQSNSSLYFLEPRSFLNAFQLPGFRFPEQHFADKHLHFALLSQVKIK